MFGLATAAEMMGRGNSRTVSIVTTTLLGLLPLGGMLVGVLLLGGLGERWLEAMLAFAAAVLLYLVTEELLVEAHEVPETPLATAMFFAGFLGLLLLEMAS
jgi:ZIP family zinc transporter